MIQLQVVIEWIPHTCKNCEGSAPCERPTIRLAVNKLEREDACDEEREMAGAIEELHAGVFEMIAKSEGGIVKEIH